jgi:hypothetical protein
MNVRLQLKRVSKLHIEILAITNEVSPLVN